MKSCGQTWLAVLILLAALPARKLWPTGAAVLVAAIWLLLYQESGQGLVKRGEMI